MKEQETRPADIDELLTVEWILEEMGKVASKGSGHLTKVGCILYSPVLSTYYANLELRAMGFTKRLCFGGAWGGNWRTAVRKIHEIAIFALISHLDKSSLRA